MSKNIKNIWANNKWSIVLGMLLLAVFSIFLHQHIHIVFALVNILFIFSIIGLLSKIRNKIIAKTITFITSLILSASISFAILFQSPLMVGNIASFLETNLSETISFPLAFWSTFWGCLLLTTILIFRVKKEQKDSKLEQTALYLFLTIILTVNIISIAILVRRDSHFFSYYHKELKEVPLQTIYAYSSLRLPLVYGDIFGLAVYLVEKTESWRFKNSEKKMPEGIILENEKNSIPKIYLVIGESAYRKKMSLYGYEIKTTPFLDSIAKADSSRIIFYDGIAIANITRDAVRFSLSFASPFNKNAFWTEKNSVELAKEAKYNTIWLSNQGQAGLYDNYPSYIAKSSDKTYFESKLTKDDLDLLSLLETYHKKDEKQLITFHLMGSHFPFSERYDEADDSYFEHLYTKKQHSNSEFDYDKSIYHTDRFLRNLHNYTIKEDKHSIIVYFSDHGANPERGIHGLLDFQQSEYEIPFVIITNNIGLNIDSIVQPYLSKGRINNINLPYILSQLMGYSVSDKIVEQASKNGRKVMLVNGSIIDMP